MWGCTLKMARTGSVNTDTETIVIHAIRAETCLKQAPQGEICSIHVSIPNLSWAWVHDTRLFTLMHKLKIYFFCNAQQNNTLILKIIKVFFRKTLKSWKTKENAALLNTKPISPPFPQKKRQWAGLEVNIHFHNHFLSREKFLSTFSGF